MLRLLYGASGTGKTEKIYREISDIAASNTSKIMIVVPEQFSFETERKLLSFLGERAFSNVEVYSFTRLCHRVFELYGGNNRDYADTTAKILLMDLALHEVSDSLEHYHKVFRSRPFLMSALQTVEELKVNGVSAKEYEEAVRSLKNTDFLEKLSEISTIYSAYQGILERSYKDALDDFSKALELIRANRFFEDYTVFLDEFKGFTKPEFDIIGEILKEAKFCTVSLCMDRNDESDPLFYSVKKTADRLKKIALDNGCKISKPICLEQNYRLKSRALLHLERNVFRGELLPFSEENETISVYRAVNEYDEADYAMSWILEQVQHHNCRYRDIVLMCRDLENYQWILKPAFEKYKIPFFLDSRFGIESFPPARFFTAVLETAVNRLDTENLLGFLKCGLLPFTLEEISELENYAYIWNITGSKWETEFTANPRGFKGELTEEDRATLDTLNRIRSTIITPLRHFIDKVSGASVREIAQELYQLAEKTGAIDVLKKTMESCRTEEKHDLADTYGRVWDLLIKVLDTMVLTAGDIQMDLKRFSELFMLAVQNSELSDRPQTLDCVMVGSPERMRTDSPRALVILGVNDGVFPFVPSDGTLLGDDERLALASLGLELQGDFKEKILEERFISYKALTVPTDSLLLTSRRANISGEIKQPSELLGQLEILFTERVILESENISPVFYCRSPETAFLTLANCYSQKSDFTKTLSAYFDGFPDYKARLLRLEQAMEPLAFRLEDEAVSKALFGGRVKLSPSRVEAYYRCPFAYFCRYGLKVLPRIKAELNPMERGVAIHDVLYRFVSEYGETMFDLTEEEVRSIVNRYLERYISDVMGGSTDKSKRFLASFYRLRNTIGNIVLRLIAEFKQSAFKPVDFELEIEKSADVTPLHLTTADGSEIVVGGTIDRVDLCEIDGQKYVRVVDYKSGVKKFKLSDVYYGLNLQMILYLFILWKNGKEKYNDVFPAGVLYMPAGDADLGLSRDASLDDTKRQSISQYKMNGFVLEDPQVVSAMEEKVKGIFIPVEQNKDGSLSKRSSLLKLEELGKMERYVNHLILKMAEELHCGEISASPVYSNGGKSPCEYCDYSSVCGQKATASKRPPADDLTKEQFFNEIGGEENVGTQLDSRTKAGD